MSTCDISTRRDIYLRGPNIWTYRPVIEAWIQFDGFQALPAPKVLAAYERLIKAVPALIQPGPGIEATKDTPSVLAAGIWPPHLLEHLTLVLQQLAGMPGGFGQTRATSQPGLYKVVVRAWHENVTRQALAFARTLILNALEDQALEVKPMVDTLHDLRQRFCLGPSTACIVDAADDRDIPAIRLSSGNLLQLGYGVNQRRIWTAETDNTGAIAETISRDKDLTKSLLRACGVPVPVGREVANVEDAWEAAVDLGLPVVVKPSDGNHGRGVFTNLSTKEEIERAYAVAIEEGSGVLVEQFIRGDEHRLLVVGGKLIAAAKGQDATVTGDGISSIRELIDTQLNADPRRGHEEDQPLNYVRLDSAVMLEIKRQGFGPDDVPPIGKTITIQRNGNVAFDCTEQVHPEVAAVACTAARIVGLDIAGIDLVAQDISKPLAAQQGAIVEVNAGPGLLMHLKPAQGKARQVGRDIVGYTFPPGDMARIPVTGITGTSGKTLTGKLLFKLLSLHGWKTGLACSEGLFVDHRRLHSGNCADHANGRRVLLNREVQAVIIENGCKQILTEGLAYERCEVGIITNVDWTQDLAAYEILDEQDLINIYRTQMDVVLPHGMAVLNAEDARVMALADYCDGKVTLFSSQAKLPALVNHVANGERAVFVEHGQLILAHGSVRRNLCTITSIPVTRQDTHREHITSVLAAAAAAWSLGVTPDLIEAGLIAFEWH
ncbi:cyanophycin synthetase [Zwartia panacis]|uniref:cyanophycin synthetase n=1 Tax=Zwartia panacis TaxID=2683345 RepID=UPI0025B5B306|nr:cyanophycin synthetase [Zwartia panacis]MDN4015611.1 cyanophycin synthetase [Zwartia panacis]